VKYLTLSECQSDTAGDTDPLGPKYLLYYPTINTVFPDGDIKRVDYSGMWWE